MGTPALPFQDVLDSMWAMLRARYSELGSPRVTESQQAALLRGLEELVTVGKEKLARDHLRQTRSKGALQAQIQNHKVRLIVGAPFHRRGFSAWEPRASLSCLGKCVSFLRSFNGHPSERSLCPRGPTDLAAPDANEAGAAPGVGGAF